MTRDETVALFLECEAKRAEARAAALAEGKDERGANTAGHEAAKAHWNAWAEPLLAERKAMEANGRWAAEKDWMGDLEPKNAETRDWMKKAEAIFSRRLFLVRGVEGTKETAGEEKENGDSEPPVKSIQLEGRIANFSGFIFPGDASFDSATFSGDALFRSATFSGDASFPRAIFCGDARFQSATFSGETLFGSAEFSGYTSFEEARFLDYAWFGSARFLGITRFDNACFSDDASFASATFDHNAFFLTTRFELSAKFAHVNFRRFATFGHSHFSGSTKFNAIRGERGFSMADAVFEVVPDFIQAHFEEAPRLDNLEVGSKLPELEDIEDEDRERLSRRGRWHRHGLEKSARYRRVFEAIAKDSDLRNIPARWRALKRLAIQGHDTERELEFHARELRAQRFAEDWPLPLAFWRGRAWAGFFRFWFGYFYQWFSDFGRSLARPLIASALLLIAAAAFYLSQTDVMQREVAPQEASDFSGTVRTARHALFNAVPCYSPPPTRAESWRGAWPWWRRAAKLAPPPAPNESQIGGLTEPFRSQTGARAEALHLAFRNAFVVLDGSAEAAHRTFGCLYGVELYGGSNPLAIVPSAVSTVSAGQKLFSALMIFLFGLALRNMLKMK